MKYSGQSQLLFCFSICSVSLVPVCHSSSGREPVLNTWEKSTWKTAFQGPSAQPGKTIYLLTMLTIIVTGAPDLEYWDEGTDVLWMGVLSHWKSHTDTYIFWNLWGIRFPFKEEKKEQAKLFFPFPRYFIFTGFLLCQRLLWMGKGGAEDFLIVSMFSGLFHKPGGDLRDTDAPGMRRALIIPFLSAFTSDSLYLPSSHLASGQPRTAHSPRSLCRCQPVTWQQRQSC